MEKPRYLQRIIDYIKKNLKKGYTMDSLKWALLRQGYSRALVDRAVNEVIKEQAIEAPILKDKPVIKHEIIDEYNEPIQVKKSFWQRIFG